MKIHIIQHVRFEHPGYLLNWMTENGHEVSFTYFFQSGFELPNPKRIDALVILGGPMNANDEHFYPWLTAEKAFIKACIQLDKKVLGICLGAQLIACCLGAAVKTAPHPEIGWFKVYPTEDYAITSGFLNVFETNPTVLHWHGDQFAIPEGCVNLLNSQGNTNQAFLKGNTILGLQFHLEADQDSVLDMTKNCGVALRSSTYVQSISEIHEGIRHCQPNQTLVDQLLTWFLHT